MAKAPPPVDHERLQRFLTRRRLDDRVVKMLITAKDEHDLKRGELTTAQNATYAKLTEDLMKGVSKGWIGRADVVAMLDGSEIAGRQHVLIFLLPESGRKKVLEALRNPKKVYAGPVNLDEFYAIPEHSTARILHDSEDEVVVKLVARRSYWVTEVLRETEDEQFLRKHRENERSAVIVKCDAKSGLFQVRVQPREKGQADTGKLVYDFMCSTLGAHYDLGGSSWFPKLVAFAIGDTFPKILKNRQEFRLRYDTPEDPEFKAQMFRKGNEDSFDLRDDQRWSFRNGYSRNSIRGVWICPRGGEVLVHLNQDNVRLGANTTRDVARVFVPGLCSDKDLDHAIQRIHEHL